MFGGGPQPQPKADNGEAKQLTSALGIGWDAGQSVWDTYDPHPEMSEVFQNYDVVYIDAKSRGSMPFSDRSPITSGLQEAMLFYPGNLMKREDTKFDFVPLMRTSPNAYTLEWDEYVSSSPFGMLQLLPNPKRRSLADTEYVVAVQVKGESSKPGDESAKTKVNCVFLADLDMISNEFFFVRDKQWRGLKLDNITFVMNAVDALAGDESFIDLRKRRAHHRTLTAVERQTQTFKKAQVDQQLKADEDAKRQLEEAKARFQDEIKKIQADKSLDERTKMIRVRAAQENERRRLEVEEAEIQNQKNKKIKESKNQSERAIRRIEDGIRLFAILLPPVPALLLGMFVFATRVRDERQGIVRDRMISKKR
jgi:ABC-2 type transport system permease protein